MTVIIVQPVVPHYRLGLLQRMARRLGPGFAVYASAQDLGVLTERPSVPNWERPLGPIRKVFPGLNWQSGALSIPIRQGDMIVVSGAPRCLSNILLLIKARLKGAQTMWWGHYWSSTSRRWRATLRFALMHLSDAVLFYTDEEVASFLRERGRSQTKALFALNNAIETAEIHRLRAVYIVNHRPRDLVFIGRITDKCGLDTLLAALATPICSDVTLDVIGSGEREADIRERSDALGLGDRIHWHGGTTDERRIAAIANLSKLFVYPGGVGLSLIHALNYGLPAILHEERWAHMPEFAALAPGENGLLFRKDDWEDLARVIAKALADPARLAAMSAAAIESTAHTFNMDDMAERFCSAIELMQGGRKTAESAQTEAAP